MTRVTIISNAGVIKDRWTEGNVRVANVAILARGQMACRLNNRRCGKKESTGVTTFAAR